MTPISTATNTVGKAIRFGFGNDVSGIGINPSGTTAYIMKVTAAPPFPGTVVPVDIATGVVGKAIRVGWDPQSIAFTP